MNKYYADIIEKIADPILWWDENAVPRFCEFQPSEVANIYADEIALLLIACQYCGTEFKVAISRSTFDRHVNHRPFLANDIKNHRIAYGDPPNANCCAPGPTMNADELKVLEYWQRDNNFEWSRIDEYEIVLDQEAVDAITERTD